jgi:hypothetical protein
MIDALLSMPFDWLVNGTGLHLAGLHPIEDPWRECLI